jgi:hypothetical protein
MSFAIAVSALLPACVGMTENVPTSVGEPQTEGSWMAGGDAKSTDLLYVSYYESEVIGIFDYPSGKMTGAITGVGFIVGLCTDADGDVFVGRQGSIIEYRHGATTPVATLNDGKFTAWACSVDPTTGNLAVANTGRHNDNVAVYAHAAGKPTIYRNPFFSEYFGCGYDAAGNLYVLAFRKGSGGPNLLGELPKGESAIKIITLSHTPVGQGGLQWDGKYLAVSSPGENAIFQFKIRGKLGKKVGETVLSGGNGIEQFSFPDIHGEPGQTTKIVGNNTASDETLEWPYPGGGSPDLTIHTKYTAPVSAVVSVASSAASVGSQSNRSQR